MTSQTPTWSATPSGRAAPGSIIGGRYALRAAIGTGGMGSVWRATDMLLRREVAVKEVVCPPGLAPSDRDAMYERTLREARAAAALSHPSVVQVYDVVTEDGRPWIVMELLDARSLADIVIEDGPLAPRAVAKIGIALLGALEVAHAAGVLHRDVKPANVLICSDGRCVLTDFGVARMPTDVQLTTPGMVLGSPHFISPERAMGGPFGPPSDLFSLGVSLYTAVEGRPPFDRGDPIETMHAVVEEPPAPSVQAGPLAGVLMGLLEKDPSRRWTVPMARSVLRDLIAGPLTSRARDHVTDPYAVVPTQRVSAPPPSVHNGHIGGRAMLPANESLEEAIARSRSGTALPNDAPQPNNWAPAGTAWVQPSHGHRSTTYAAQAHSPAVPHRATEAGRNAVAAIKRWPAGVRVAVAGTTAAVLVLLAVVLADPFGGGGENPPGAAPPVVSTAPTSEAPLIEVQQHQQGPIMINVPAGWTKKPASNYVDFTDSDGRKVRILIENKSVTSRDYLEDAEANLKRPSVCPAPYKRVDMRETTLVDQPATELEYTCGSGEKARHGIWRAVVINGKAYGFYLTVPEAMFADSKKIFDELVRSFRLTA